MRKYLEKGEQTKENKRKSESENSKNSLEAKSNKSTVSSNTSHSTLVPNKITHAKLVIKYIFENNGTLFFSMIS